VSNHERFEELCVMAAAGEISTAERQELIRHLEDCASCRETFAEMKDIHATWLPEREGFEIERSFGAESKLRQLILQRVEAEGAQFSDEVLLPTFPVSHVARPHTQMSLHRVLAIAAVVLVALVGVGIFGRLKLHRVASQSSAAEGAGAVAQNSSVSGGQAAQLEVMREDLRQTQLAQEKLATELKDAQAQSARLEQLLEEAQGKAGALQQSNAAATQEVSNLQTQLDAARGTESKVEEQLASLKASASDKETELTVVESENRDLHDKLSQQEASVDRERELMADGREIRDLIAARNLHIIDVYDTSGQGLTQKSFGRVFYTEGKSLVFYAYDLPSRRPATKYAFYAWGKRDGSGDVKVRNLGIFYNDDQTQKRWVLKISDPQVLSEIDSVFVTLEKTGDFGNTPTGKKLLSAYLGSPANHP
jgi:anti-sigma factor RsiW